MATNTKSLTAKARRIASIMGFRLGVLNLPSPEATCEQRVKP